MKAKIFIVAAVAVMVLGSCSWEKMQTGNDSRQMQEYEFKASFADGTKTAVQSDGSVWWSSGEKIIIFYGDKTQGTFTSTNKSAAQSTTFKGKFDSFDGSIELGTTSSSFWAVYPYTDSTTFDGSSVTLTVPSSQTAAEGSFNDNMFPSIAKSNTLSLSFWNLCGGVKFTVSQEGIKQVTFKGNNNETIAGTVQVMTDSGGRPYVCSSSNAETEVVVKLADDAEFKTGTDYYIVMLPATLSNGYSLTFTKASTAGTYTCSSSRQIKRSIFGVLSEKDKGLTFSE